MDIGSIFLLLALLILVAFFVAQPLLNRQRAAIRPSADTRQRTASLRAERAQVIQSLQELDFDYSLGKMPDEDYPGQRNSLLMQGVEVLQKLDALHPQPSAQNGKDQIEEALAARRKTLSESPAEAFVREQNEELEALIAARRRARNGSAPREKSIGFCPKCGKSIQKSDRFCPKCGTELS